MKKLLFLLLSCIGCQPRDLWREAVYNEAYSRGCNVEEIKTDDGKVIAYRIVDPTGQHPTIRIGAGK